MKTATHRPIGTTQQTEFKCSACKHWHCELQAMIEETARRNEERWLLWNLAP